MDVPVTEARAQFADLVNRVAYTGDPVRLTRRGRVMAALVSPEDLELLELARSRRLDLARDPAREQPAQLQGQPAQQQGQPAQPAERPQPSPLRIAAEYRPPGFNR
ncbi:type II toxin-antitoxin system Phd/YefM family antitoxin [Actinomadura sp. 7K534]|uniref:type II toxin-antitoxin system Phd/YefM family antitoxin n=1 Tax=Actinomadura sp. 7K534 TaxID=2530366 RepID=UPI0010450CB8|nr:type II toxin-antitoxin system Phd/YefM family antitoxin [Actinomadura sp. 7K534]TDB86527.1 type II toxin-antitoxin system Phd/YefM family antitoxin [Actinomadura sp. 7K534]